MLRPGCVDPARGREVGRPRGVARHRRRVVGADVVGLGGADVDRGVGADDAGLPSAVVRAYDPARTTAPAPTSRSDAPSSPQSRGLASRRTRSDLATGISPRHLRVIEARRLPRRGGRPRPYCVRNEVASRRASYLLTAALPAACALPVRLGETATRRREHHERPEHPDEAEAEDGEAQRRPCALLAGERRGRGPGFTRRGAAGAEAAPRITHGTGLGGRARAGLGTRGVLAPGGRAGEHLLPISAGHASSPTALASRELVGCRRGRRSARTATGGDGLRRAAPRRSAARTATGGDGLRRAAPRRSGGLRRGYAWRARRCWLCRCNLCGPRGRWAAARRRAPLGRLSPRGGRGGRRLLRYSVARVNAGPS